MPSLVISRNPFNPTDREVRLVKTRSRIKALAPTLQYPMICIYNGKPLLRAGWGRRLRSGDVVQFVGVPRGGGVMRIILMIVVIVVAWYVAPYLAGYFGTGASSVGLWQAAVVMVGSVLVNALLPPPKLPTAQLSAEMAAASPTYSLQAQGNSARLEQPIPVQYGRMIAYPDFGAMPYAEYSGNDQYLYQLFVLGQGDYAIEEIRIEDTPISNFTDITVEIIPPGGRVTLFPSEVITSSLVAGQELTGGIGPFAASGPGTVANAIGVDLVCPGGLYYGNDSGGFDARSCTVRFDARRIDDLDNVLSDWIVLGTETISGATNTPIRNSYRYTVAEARYQVRATRTDPKDTNSRASDSVIWDGLRAYLPGDQQYGGVTLIAMRMRATNQLSSQASRKVNVIATRKLPVWSPTTGWSAPVATRSIAWALADICRADYGPALADDRYDLAALYSLDQTWTARDDSCDCRFDSKQTFWESLTLAGRTGRAKPYQQAGLICFWRDSPVTIPVAMFSPRNILKDSFKLSFAPASTDASDSVRMAYWDETVWTQRDVTCALPDSSAAKPADVDAFGMVKRRQVVCEGMYMTAASRFRRRFASFRTEMDGFIPRFGDLVLISHDVPGWGQSGDIVDVLALNTPTPILTLSETPIWTAGATHYICLSRSDGSIWGPVVVTAVSGDSQSVTLASVPDFQPESVGATRERTRYAFGPATNLNAKARIQKISPKSAQTVEITTVLEDSRVHTADQGITIPTDVFQLLPNIPTAPQVKSLTVSEGGSPDQPVLAVSWPAAPGADSYVLESSTDGVYYIRVADTSATHYSLVVAPGLLYLRVAGYGILQGPWATWSGIAGATVAAPSAITDLTLAEAFNGPSLRLKWSPPARATSYRVEIWAGSPVDLHRSVVVTDTSFEYSWAQATADGGPWRSFTVKVTPLGIGPGPTASLAVNNPNVGQLNNIQVSAIGSGAIWSCDWPADSDVAGFVVYAANYSGFTPGPSNLRYDGAKPISQLALPAGYTWYVRCGAYDVWGKDGIQLSGEFTVSPQLITSTNISPGAITTPLLGANAVTAEKMSVVSLGAISANLGSVSTGQLDVQSNGSGGYGYARSAGKWFADGNNGWVFARAPDGSNFAEMKAGSSRLWLSSWGDFGISFPGISMGPSGLTINQANVIDTLQIAGGAVTVPASAVGTTTAEVTITVPAEAAVQPVMVWAGQTTNISASPGYSYYQTTRYVHVYRDGVEIKVARDDSYNIDPVFSLVTSVMVMDTPGAGTHTYTVSVFGYSGVPAGDQTTIVAMLTKR